MITVALVDDHITTRKGIKTIIELNPRINVVFEASNGQDLLDNLSHSEIHPDIILLDINMPVMNGFTAIEKLQELYPSIYIIIFSLLYEEDAVINAITKGASGFINKSADPSTLADAITTVYKTGFYLGDLVKKEYFKRHFKEKKKAGFNGKQFLSNIELEFIRLSATKLTYPEIAAQMGLKPKTIENYQNLLFRKLSIKNRATLVLYGLNNGIINSFPEK